MPMSKLTSNPQEIYDKKKIVQQLQDDLTQKSQELEKATGTIETLKEKLSKAENDRRVMQITINTMDKDRLATIRVSVTQGVTVKLDGPWTPRDYDRILTPFMAAIRRHRKNTHKEP